MSDKKQNRNREKGVGLKNYKDSYTLMCTVCGSKREVKYIPTILPICCHKLMRVL